MKYRRRTMYHSKLLNYISNEQPKDAIIFWGIIHRLFVFYIKQEIEDAEGLSCRSRISLEQTDPTCSEQAKPLATGNRSQQQAPHEQVKESSGSNFQSFNDAITRSKVMKEPAINEIVRIARRTDTSSSDFRTDRQVQ